MEGPGCPRPGLAKNNNKICHEGRLLMLTLLDSLLFPFRCVRKAWARFNGRYVPIQRGLF